MSQTVTVWVLIRHGDQSSKKMALIMTVQYAYTRVEPGR